MGYNGILASQLKVNDDASQSTQTLPARTDPVPSMVPMLRRDDTL